MAERERFLNDLDEMLGRAEELEKALRDLLAASVERGHCPLHGNVDMAHRCRDFDGMGYEVDPAFPAARALLSDGSRGGTE